MSKTRLLLADDHTLVRQSLRLLLRGQPDLEVVGDAGTAPEVVPLALATAPDIVCLDISMPGGGGLRVVDRLRRECPAARVLILTMHDDPAFLRSALAAGCLGYVLKSSPPEALIAAIRAVRAGQTFVDEALRSHLVAESPRRPEGRLTNALPAALSERERQVLILLAQGASYLQIGAQLFVSVKTVETYRTRLGAKLGLKTRADLVRYALDTGLLTPGQ